MSWLQLSVFSKYYLFLVVQVFLVTTLANAVLKNISAMISSPTDIPNILGHTIPTGASFFTTYILFTGLTGFSLKILRIVPLIWGSIQKKYIVKTKREREQVLCPESIDYGIECGDHLLMYLVTMAYSVISPIILIFSLVYFGLGYLVNRYMLLYVYVPRFESGGVFWPMMFDRMIASLLIAQVTLLGVFGFMEVPYLASLLFPLPFLTLVFASYTRECFFRKSQFLPAEESLTVDQKGGNYGSLQKRDDEKKEGNVRHPYEQPEMAAPTQISATDIENKVAAEQELDGSQHSINPV